MSILFILFVFAAGLVVGWNFLPQPEIVRRWVDRIRDRFSK